MVRKMGEKKKKKNDKKRICIEIDPKLFKNVNRALVEIHGTPFGYFTKTVERGLQLWLKKEKSN